MLECCDVLVGEQEWDWAVQLAFRYTAFCVIADNECESLLWEGAQSSSAENTFFCHALNQVSY